MKAKKISLIIVASLFLLSILGCLFGLFTTKKVQVNYAVSSKIITENVQPVFDEFVGKNLLFLNLDIVEDAISDNLYLEIVSVKKDFPNVLTVNVKERREVYYLKNGDEYLVTTENGFILRKAYQTEVKNYSGRDKILFTLDGVNITNAKVGKVVETDSQSLIETVFEMAKNVELTDCIKSIEVFKPNVPGANVTFKTYTGVNVEIAKAEEKGVEKVVFAFNAYDNAPSDYVKMFSTIKVNLLNGQPNVVWSSSK